MDVSLVDSGSPDKESFVQHSLPSSLPSKQRTLFSELDDDLLVSDLNTADLNPLLRQAVKLAGREPETTLATPRVEHERSLLNVSSGIHCYSERTKELLASYFLDSLSGPRRSELAGLLVFPTLPAAAALVAKKIENGLSPREDAQLTALTIFPENARAANLYEVQLSGRRALTIKEKAELYAIRAKSELLEGKNNNPLDNGDIAQEVSSALRAAADAAQNEDEQKRIVLKFVRQELERGGKMVSSTAQLRELFDLSRAAVDRILADPRDGLNAREIQVREQRLSWLAEEPKLALAIRRINALRDFISIENELHQTGVIETLSSTRQLGELAGLTPQKTAYALRFLPLEQQRYRDEGAGKETLVDKQKELITLVRNDMQAKRDGRVQSLRSDVELGQILGLAPITVWHYLRQTLSKQDCEFRDYLLREQKGASPLPQSASSFIKGELEAFRRGEINRLSAESELAELFKIPEHDLVECLQSEMSGLSFEDHKLRALVIALQQPPSATSVALRQTAIVGVRDAICRYEDTLRSDPGPTEGAEDEELLEREARPKNKRVFRGLTFDSLEEAACAALLEKYVDNFKLIPGKTYQVPVKGRYVDFIVNGDVVEYHPILLFWSASGTGSMKSLKEYLEFNAVKSELSGKEKSLFIGETKAFLAKRYQDERAAILRSSPLHRNSRLVVALSPEEFYYTVIRAHATNPPSLEKFQIDFERIKGVIRRGEK